MFSRRRREDAIKIALEFHENLERMGLHDLAEKDRQLCAKLYDSKPPAKELFAWVGINPELKSFSFEELYRFAVEKVPFDEYQMAVEQHTKGGIRPHLHLLIKVSKNTRKNHIVTRLAKLFNIANNCIQVRLSCNDAQIEAWLKYLSGDKSASKLEDVAKDREDRQKYNIPDIYKCPTLP